jgi:hypothetical protein
MRKLSVLVLLISSAMLTQAQRFFFVETSQVTGHMIEDRLIKEAQFVAKTPLISDYIIKAEMGFQSGANVLNLEMTLQDSVTLKTIFQTKEEHTLGTLNSGTPIFLRMAIISFIDKNINQMIDCAREDHSNTQLRFLKSRKDKI